MKWVKNSPLVEKPRGECIVRLGEDDYALGTCRGEIWRIGNGGYHDHEVTHFALITDPEAGDDQR